MSEVLQFPSRPDPAGPAFDLRDMIRDVCDSLEPLCLRRRVDLEPDVPSYTIVRADRARYRRTLETVIGTALRLTPAGRELALVAHADRTGVSLEIIDSCSVLADLNWMESGSLPAVGGACVDVAELQHVAAACGANVRVAPCGDGGLAFAVRTLHEPVAVAAPEAKKAAA